jgi:YbbR domain-containing protein
MAQKIWSIVLAVMLWMVVSGEETVERGLRVPLELQQFPAGLELQTDAPSLVDVRVRGASGTLSRMGPGDIVAVLDLRAARAGRRLYQITPEQVRAPYGVQIVQVIPPSVALVFEDSVTKPLPVSAEVEGSPAPGFVVGKITIDPKTVDVVGPESAVQRASEALTESISVANATHDVSDSVNVGFSDPSLRLKSPRLVTVTVQIVPGPVERVLNDQAVHLRNLGAGLSAQVVPAAADLVLRGSRQGIGKIVAAEVTAYVELAGLGVGDYALPVKVEAAPEAGIARINPATVRVRIVRGKN